MSNLANAPANALAAKEARDKSFRKKGILIALLSGFLYGGYTAFMTHGMESGVWIDFYGATGIAKGLSAFALIYTLSALGAAVNDLCSAVWSLIYAAIIGRLGDFKRSLRTKPGRILIIAAIIGGPFASTCYVIGLQMAGSIIVPIAALNAAIGAIIGRFLYKQKLSAGMILGIVICFCAAVLIGSTGMTGLSFDGKAVLGMAAAFLAALGWGIEGAVGGYACCIVDYEVAIVIRQCTSGIVNAVILVSILSIMGGDKIGTGFRLLGAALTDGPSIWMFFIAGMFASFSFKFWYKGASMCGAALGMGCNGTYAFWGPFWCFIVIGLVFGVDGYAIPWQGWVGALIMVVGIVILAISQDKATKEA
ncbi:MAG: hypothetical protein MSS48_00895 [Clostridiales bacterium]|uniref:hypothetical protein n=1 Tax=Hornefia butyriciproducens TaxID=2652293 RepID=UPI0023EFF543|nr:hypothetical protein [Hornefia butyriciproducens]MCI7328027.1 hypothetical protein [Clostridiales bacterium]MCI7412249.1 hypothetical protein [Clostridiales bacterium]MCI7678762.1 hypothetical protein [Clostridiales bacterium]MDD6299817.1 hypothetical protein [Hornefia butyriciproducens]MDD7020127.1 hypothetical protein [Hornefia butyriciproducens]